MRRFVWLLVLLLMTGCAGATQPHESTPKTSAPATSPVSPGPGRQEPAWQHLFDRGSADLYYAAPDGSGFLFLDTQTEQLLPVRAADSAVHELDSRTLSFNLGGNMVQAHIAETPYGAMLVSRDAHGDMGLAPDRQQLAIGRNGLWVANVKTGDVRRIGSKPEPAPGNLSKHTVWAWAAYPTWSEDGQWIYFYSNRLRPEEFTRWRVPAGGGTEELVSREDKGPFSGARLPDGRIVRVERTAILVFPVSGGDPVRVADDFSQPYSLSPDGRWVLALSTDRSALRTYEVVSGKRREIPLPPGSLAELSPIWNGNLALFRIRPVSYAGPAFLSVLDLQAGVLSYFTPPEPARGDVWPLGWTPDGGIVARILPLPDFPYSLSDEAHTAPSGVWILDRTRYHAPAGTTPSVLRYAGVVGPGPTWNQVRESGPVTGGKTSAEPDSMVILRFDQPLNGAWTQNEVQVEGPGTVGEQGAPLGVVSIRLSGARAGDVIRVKIPTLGFDLQLEVCVSCKA